MKLVWLASWMNLKRNTRRTGNVQRYVHLIEKGYVNGRREGRVFYYSSAINDKKFLEAQVKQFMNFWFDGSLEELVQYACLAKGISKKNAAEVVAAIKELEKK